MRVYVESNFLLELALRQEEHDACRSLLEEAERGRCELAIPAFSLVEAARALDRRLQEWEERVHQVKKLFLDMGRTASLAADASSVHAAVTTQARAATDSARDDRRRVVAIARVLPLDEGTLRDAMPLSEAEGLTLPDATILACILLDASTDRPSCFLNKNKKDFGRDVANLLAPKSCRLITSFADGLAYVRSLLLPTRGSASVRSPSDPIASATTLRSPWRIWRTGRRPR